MTVLILSLAAFLIGSVPTGLIIAQNKGVDLKKVGSGNIGATNVLRSLGKGPALMTLIGDIGKGIVPVLAAKYFDVGLLSEGWIGLSAILGHNFSIFLRFRGGKGVATSIGVLCVFSPQTAVFTIIIWIMVALTTKYSSLGALVSFGLLPVNMYFFDSREKIPAALAITILLVLKHRENIANLLRGTERRIGGSK